jgi:hypothetical protein
MWPDNETDIDLLGFDFLVDELLVLLKQPQILPLTIGVTGDWGSGKSSLLSMTAKELRDDKEQDYAVVEFSPWRYQDYEDVKAALLAAVLGEVHARVAKAPDGDKKRKLAGLLRRLVLRVKWISLARAGSAAVLAGHTGIPTEQVALLAGGAMITSDLEKKQEAALEAAGSDVEPPPATLADFRSTFGQLMQDLDVGALVVLVDDLDRCLPDTIIDVFEAVRLFLNVPKTAFVIAADQRIVQAAVEHAYPQAVARDASVGTDYLEKILQVTVSIPPLSVAESETYINLLMAQASSSPEDFARLVAAAKSERDKAYLSVAMNHGIAAHALGTVPKPLADAFAIANRIAPTLAPKHHGNPRQIKRFMNLLQLRLGAATRRHVDLDPTVLAKLMVLEAVAPDAYRRLFEWQAVGGGKPVELSQAEKSNSTADDDTSPAVKEWLAGQAVSEWLKIEPQLTNVDLGPFFFFSRDRFTPALPAARLTPELQAILAALRSDDEGPRTEAIASAVALGTEDFGELYPQLLEDAVRSPRGPGMKAAVAIAARVPNAVPILKKALGELPISTVPASLPMTLKAQLGDGINDLSELLDRWESDTGELGRAVKDARKRRGH